MSANGFGRNFEDSAPSPSPEKESFHWSFDEIRNIFVRSRNSGDRERSTNSFTWSLSSTFDALRARFSFGSVNSNTAAAAAADQSTSIDNSEDRGKKFRFDEDDREIVRETQREARRKKASSQSSNATSKKEKKCEKEKDRRNHVNGLFYRLGELVGLPGVKSKTEILDKARTVLKEAEAKELEALIMHHEDDILQEDHFDSSL